MGNDVGFVMQTGQMFSGTGTELRVGGVSIPPLTPGRMPMMTNTGGNGVTLADNTTVQGLFINDPTGTGITGALGITNVVISSNHIVTTLSTVISLPSAQGSHIVESNTINSDGIGILMSGQNRFQQVEVRNNNVSTAAAAAVQIFNSAIHGNNMIIEDNILTTTGSAVAFFDVSASAPTQVLQIHRNSFMGQMFFSKPVPGDVCLFLTSNSGPAYNLQNTGGGTFQLRSSSQAAFEAANTVVLPGAGFLYTPGPSSFLFSSSPCP